MYVFSAYHTAWIRSYFVVMACYYLVLCEVVRQIDGVQVNITTDNRGATDSGASTGLSRHSKIGTTGMSRATTTPGLAQKTIAGMHSFNIILNLSNFPNLSSVPKFKLTIVLLV